MCRCKVARDPSRSAHLVVECAPQGSSRGSKAMREKDWDLLLLMLEQQNCVLLLGGQALPSTHEVAAARLAQNLATELGRLDLAEQGLAHVAERYENSERFS